MKGVEQCCGPTEGAERCRSAETFFYDLHDGFVVLRHFGTSSPRSRAALDLMRGQLPSILRDTRIDRGWNHFSANLLDADGGARALLRLTIFVEDPLPPSGS